jgi:hypothetical protein
VNKQALDRVAAVAEKYGCDVKIEHEDQHQVILNVFNQFKCEQVELEGTPEWKRIAYIDAACYFVEVVCQYVAR